MHSLSGDIYRQVREYFCSGQTSQMPRNVAKSSGIPLKVRQGSRFPLSDVLGRHASPAAVLSGNAITSCCKRKGKSATALPDFILQMQGYENSLL